MYAKNSHCSYCGHPFDPDQGWPRTCDACHNMSFLNPLPVAIVIQPVVQRMQEQEKVGLLLIRRAIQPQRDKWALPGGYIDRGESWQEAAARELHEEAAVCVDPARVELLAVHSGDDGVTLIVAGRAPPLTIGRLPPFVANRECSARAIVTASQVDAVDFAFPLHRRLVRDYFRKDV